MPALPINNVNFIRSHRWQVEQGRRRDLLLLRVGLGFFVVALLITTGMVAYSHTLNQQISKINGDIATQQALVNRLAGSEANYLIFTTRLDVIKTVLESRHQNAMAFAFIQKLMLPQLSFDQIRVDPQTRQLQFMVRARSILAADTFLTTINQPSLAKEISELKLSEIKRDENGGYSIMVTVLLKSGGATP